MLHYDWTTKGGQVKLARESKLGHYLAPSKACGGRGAWNSFVFESIGPRAAAIN